MVKGGPPKGWRRPSNTTQKERGKGQPNALKKVEEPHFLTLHVFFSFLVFRIKKTRERRRQHQPQGGRIKQHHTKDGWDSSITQHRTGPKGRLRKAAQQKRALETTNLLLSCTFSFDFFTFYLFPFSFYLPCTFYLFLLHFTFCSFLYSFSYLYSYSFSLLLYLYLYLYLHLYLYFFLFINKYIYIYIFTFFSTFFDFF